MKKLLFILSVLLSTQLYAQIPGEPFNPMTANGARHVCAYNTQWFAHTLFWQNPVNITYNDIYISTDSNLVINLDPSAKILSGQDSLKTFSSLSLEAIGSLNLHTKYYWRVVEYNLIGYNAGPVWYFISQSSNYNYWVDDFSNGLSNYSIIQPQGANWSISNTNNAGGWGLPELLLQVSSNFSDTTYLVLNEIFDLCTSINGVSFNYNIDWISGEFNIGLAYSLDEGNSWRIFWQQTITEDISASQVWVSQVPNENYVKLALFCISNQTNSIGSFYIDDLTLGTPLTVPAPPGQIQALADSLSTTVSLTWSSGSAPDPISGYRIQRKDGLPTDASAYNTIAETDENTLSYSDVNVQLSHIYTYRVQTLVPVYSTTWSNEATAYVPSVTPVELLAFSSSIVDNSVTLNWSTATETNNLGFEIQKLKDSNIDKLKNWEMIDFISGHGTTTEPQIYSYKDKNLSTGKYQYRLKQIDFDGSFKYSQVVEATIATPYKFSISQNYPNPFNPDTKIKFAIPKSSLVNLSVFDILGNRVLTLVNQEKQAGEYEIEFDGNDLPSGVYFYQIKAGKFIQTRKMILMK